MPESPAPQLNPARNQRGRSRGTMFVLTLLAVAAGVGAWLLWPRRDQSELMNLAQQAAEKGDVAAAYGYLKAATSNVPKTENESALLAEFAIRQGMLDDAQNWIATLPETSPASMRFRESAARIAMEQADVARVESLLLAGRDSTPLDRNARNLLTRLYQLTGREAELRNQIASQDRDAETRLDGDVLCLYCIGARVYGDQSEPQEWLLRAIQRNPRNNCVRASLAELLIQSTERDRSRELLQQASPNEADYWRVKVVQMQDLLQQRKFVEVSQILSTLDTAADGDPRAWVIRGKVAAAKGDAKQAHSDFETAMRIDPFGPEQVSELAKLVRKEGEPSQARELFQRAELLIELSRAATYVLMNPGDRKGALQQAASYCEKLRFWRLVYLFQRILASDFPDLAEARVKVAELRKNPEAMLPLSTRKPRQP